MTNRCIGITSTTDLLQVTYDIDDDFVHTGTLDANETRRFVEKLSSAIGAEPIASFMSEDVYTVRQDATVVHAARAMLKNQVHHLPVVDSEDRLVGILSTMDIMATIVDETEEEANTMKPITRILCPVDFSEPSLHALSYAKAFAETLGADLILLNAFSVPSSYDMEGQRHPADPKVMDQLKALKTAKDKVNITAMGHAGLADEVICWAAEDQNCQLIIMGTHGRSGFKHLLFGSTAEAVLRNARCPVMAIREQKTNQQKLDEPTMMPLPAPRYM